MSHKPEVIVRARMMRSRGMSVPSIAAALIVAKSTISGWVRDVTMSEVFIQRLRQGSFHGSQRGLAKIRAIRNLQHAQRVQEATETVRTVLGNADIDSWKVVAAIMFWCEGSKRHLSSARFTNSDPLLVRVFLRALRSGFGIRQEKLSALLHLHDYHDEREMIAYWAKVANIPSSQFHRSYVKRHTGKRKRKDYHGCISVRYGEANLARRLDAIYHEIAERWGRSSMVECSSPKRAT